MLGQGLIGVNRQPEAPSVPGDPTSSSRFACQHRPPAAEGFEERGCRIPPLARQAKTLASGSDQQFMSANAPPASNTKPAAQDKFHQSQEERARCPPSPRSAHQVWGCGIGATFNHGRCLGRIKMLCVIAATQTAETEHHEADWKRHSVQSQGYRRHARRGSLQRRRCSAAGVRKALNSRAVSATERPWMRLTGNSKIGNGERASGGVPIYAAMR